MSGIQDAGKPFSELASKLVKVPKAEIKDAAKKYKAKKRRKKK